MANKGENTNTSQFFILYRPAQQLDRRHTIFGRVVRGQEVIDRMESTPVDEGDRPLEDIVIQEVMVFIDPFQEFLARVQEINEAREERKRNRGTKQNKITSTGKRLLGDDSAVGPKEKKIAVGNDLKGARGKDQARGVGHEAEEPFKKKWKCSGGGFGNLDACSYPVGIL